MLKLNSKIGQLSIITLLTLMIIYFCYHIIKGERGVLAYFELEKKVNTIQVDLDKVKLERLELEHYVNLMRPESLDIDLLDEQVRKTIGYAKPTEAIYFLHNNKVKK